MAISPAALEQFRGVLVRTGGGYLRNPIRTHRVTCAVCTTPCPGHERCATCQQQLHEPGRRADQVAALTYVFSNKQSGYVMRGYKAQPRPVQEHRDRNPVRLRTQRGAAHPDRSLRGDLSVRGGCAQLTANRSMVTALQTLPPMPEIGHVSHRGT